MGGQRACDVGFLQLGEGGYKTKAAGGVEAGRRRGMAVRGFMCDGGAEESVWWWTVGEGKAGISRSSWLLLPSEPAPRRTTLKPATSPRVAAGSAMPWNRIPRRNVKYSAQPTRTGIWRRLAS